MRLKSALSRIVHALPGGPSVLNLLRYRHSEYRRLRRMGSSENIFSHHFEVKKRGGEESVSGPGSTIEYTENIRKEIPGLVERLGVRTLFDAPCGDFNWFRMIKWKKEIHYTGGDIVQPIIDQNQLDYGGPNLEFIRIDITHGALPDVDLWLCRDCLFHLSNQDIMMVFDNFLKSNIRYLLTSTHTDCDQNLDIPTGSFRQLNLSLPPFNLPEPSEMLADWIEGYPVRHLALWEHDVLKKSLSENKIFQSAVNEMNKRS